MLFLIVNICLLLQNVTASIEKMKRPASYLMTLSQDVKELVKLPLQCISKIRGMVHVKSSFVSQMIRKDKDSPWLLFCFEIWQVLEIWTKEDFFSVGQTLQLLLAQNFPSFSQGWDKQDPSSGERCRHLGSPKGCALESSSLKEAALSGFWISRPMVIFSVPGNRISAVTLLKAQESSLNFSFDFILTLSGWGILYSFSQRHDSSCNCFFRNVKKKISVMGVALYALGAWSVPWIFPGPNCYVALPCKNHRMS